MPTYNISDSEWQVMQFVWDRKSATAAEVISALVPETRWSHRTIRTLVILLVAVIAVEFDMMFCAVSPPVLGSH